MMWYSGRKGTMKARQDHAACLDRNIRLPRTRRAPGGRCDEKNLLVQFFPQRKAAATGATAVRCHIGLSVASGDLHRHLSPMSPSASIHHSNRRYDASRQPWKGQRPVIDSAQVGGILLRRFKAPRILQPRNVLQAGDSRVMQIRAGRP